jgi:hypothetical protein
VDAPYCGGQIGVAYKAISSARTNHSADCFALSAFQASASDPNTSPSTWLDAS